MVFLLGLTAAGAHIFSPNNIIIASDITADKVIALTNESRAQKGESVLVVNSKLSRAAEAKAADMIANNYFSHTSPAGTTPWN